MVELNEEIIDVIKKVKDAIKGSSYDINRFEVGESGLNESVITIDIRKLDSKDNPFEEKK